MAVVTVEQVRVWWMGSVNREDRGDREQGPGREWLGAGQCESFGG